MTAPEGIGRLFDVDRRGRMPYDEAYALQQELLEKRVAGEIRDTLIIVEHDPVITVGRGTDVQGLSVDLPVREVERGGEATYHGPGQVVAYPIYAMPEGRRDLHRYLRDLEEVLIRVLAEVQIEGRRSSSGTGVWIGERKVASIGVAVRRWVAWHGMALNVHTDLTAFQGFKPCGLDADVMTRVADHADVPPANLLFEVLIVKHFGEVFGLELPELPPREESSFPELPILPS
ncbi:MAG: lipoyl(octanoyl) transferase LipB [Planctomycetota bacterium]|nr:lipoyl(octanoyl) transferase LipB [Planctomycetota bacterium]